MLRWLPVRRRVLIPTNPLGQSGESKVSVNKPLINDAVVAVAKRGER